MGGHGGLNILPQKKWNVYNRDSRTVVERDQRLDRERREAEAVQGRDKVTTQRLSGLRQELSIYEPNDLITQQLQTIQKPNKHVNLFEREERLISNKEVLDVKLMEEAEFLKDKPIDVSSRFLGAYNTEKMKPWYLKTEEQRQKQKLKSRVKKSYRQEIQSVKKTDSLVTQEVYIKENERQRSRDCRLVKSEVKRQEPDRQLSKIDLMRQQRLGREEKERKRAQNLKAQHKDR